MATRNSTTTNKDPAIGSSDKPTGSGTGATPPTTPAPQAATAPQNPPAVTQPPAVIKGAESIDFFDPSQGAVEGEVVAEPIPDHLELARVQPKTMSSEDLFRANQEAAKLALNRMKAIPLPTLPPPELKPMAPIDEKKLKPRVFRVTEPCRVGNIRLPAGKRFTENQYNLAELKEAGAKIEEVKEEAA